MESCGGWLRNLTLFERRDSLRNIVWRIPLRNRIADGPLGGDDLAGTQRPGLVLLCFPCLRLLILSRAKPHEVIYVARGGLDLAIFREHPRDLPVGPASSAQLLD